ncbi:ABC transporter permease subunit [Phaeobacter porticola]|uniref:ABC transporter, integral inner membrane component n=1 Tax=Phaeobacter porticola TaxID=1844006 RepID=A0A1L3IAC9_9RHOB|nr:ABC transporter permease subunit [Phaeobacter porticola]APG48991.1 ABC transporter, integral inner membrane component [Phaeobacter porticola]
MAADIPVEPGLRRVPRQGLVFCFLVAFCIVIWLTAQTGWLEHGSSRDVLVAPGMEHWLGTNEIGQDVLVGLILATPTTLALATVTAILAGALALSAASLVVLGGPLVAGVVLRTVDVLQVVPSMLLLLFVAALVNPGLIALVLLLTVTGWSDDVRIVVAVLRREVRRENILYARAMGAGWIYCWRWHLLAALRPLVGVVIVQNLRQAALKSAGLGFLGLTDPRLLTWGSMMQSAMDQLYTGAWIWLLLPPAFLLSLFLHWILKLSDPRVQSGLELEQRL